MRDCLGVDDLGSSIGGNASSSSCHLSVSEDVIEVDGNLLLCLRREGISCMRDGDLSCSSSFDACSVSVDVVGLLLGGGII